MPKVIKPDDIGRLQAESIPDEIYEIVNSLIVKNWAGNRSVVMQDDIVRLITVRMSCTRQAVFDRHWLNFEAAYRQEGWKVIYEKQCIGDTTPSHFIFSKR